MSLPILPADPSPPGLGIEEPVASTTTAEQNRHSFGQRRINLIWEVTQAIIAIVVTTSVVMIGAQLALRDNGQNGSFQLLSNAFFLVIGFYFSRSNHERINDLARTNQGGQVDTR